MYYITPDIHKCESKIHSQFGEDGVILELAKCLKIERGTYFEFGVGPAWMAPADAPLEGNFVHLKSIGWAGVFLDGSLHEGDPDVRQEMITAMNINELWRKHAVPNDLDFMSIDVDGQEFWIWMALDYSPKVMISEYNGAMDVDASVVMPFMPGHRWDGMYNNNGASLLALNKLALSKGYTLVWSNGVNAAFVRSDLVANIEDFKYELIYRQWKLHKDDPNAVFLAI